MLAANFYSENWAHPINLNHINHLNFAVPILATEINYIFYVGLGLLVIHALEFALVFNRLKQRGRAGFSDLAAVLLVGLFHWMPILRKPVA